MLQVEHNLYQCQTPVIMQLLEDKWCMYGQGIYILAISVYAMCLILLLLTVVGKLPIVVTWLVVLCVHFLSHISKVLKLFANKGSGDATRIRVFEPPLVV